MFKKRGFTLVEVILVIIIVGILAAIVIPRIAYTAKKAKQEACKANIAALNSQIELYYVQQGDYPPDIDALVGEDYIEEVPQCPFNATGDLWNYTINASTDRVIKHNHP